MLYRISLSNSPNLFSYSIASKISGKTGIKISARLPPKVQQPIATKLAKFEKPNKVVLPGIIDTQVHFREQLTPGSLEEL